MSKKAKILLILGVAVALTLVTLFMFFPKQFLTVVFWIVGTIVVVFFLFALAAGSKRRKKRYHVIVEEEDDDFDAPIRRRIPPVAPVNPKGVEFITGAKSLRKHQQDAMKRTKKNLWG